MTCNCSTKTHLLLFNLNRQTYGSCNSMPHQIINKCQQQTVHCFSCNQFLSKLILYLSFWIFVYLTSSRAKTSSSTVLLLVGLHLSVCLLAASKPEANWLFSATRDFTLKWMWRQKDYSKMKKYWYDLKLDIYMPNKTMLI